MGVEAPLTCLACVKFPESNVTCCHLCLLCQIVEEPTTHRRRTKHMTSPERWEVTQLIKSGILDVKDYPDFDNETGQVQCLPNHAAACL